MLAGAKKLPRRVVLGATAQVAGLCVGLTDLSSQDREETKRRGNLQAIDAHIHVANTHLPGVPAPNSPSGISFDEPNERLADAIRREMADSRTEHALCMPQWGQLRADDPLGVHRTLALKELIPCLHAIGIADPSRTGAEERKGVEKVLEQGVVKALKCYLGYVHAMPGDSGYTWYFKMAAKYKIPVIFHTGDTYSRKAKVKYAHPLGIDDVAVDFPEVNFVLAHLGNPWITDAAEVIYKNNQLGSGGNVWADLSALLVGPQFDAYAGSGLLDRLKKQVRHAIAYSERPDRFLYGSDWPLTKMTIYRDFISEAVPQEHHQAVFCENAKALFHL
jgi:uncharacterized protein